MVDFITIKNLEKYQPHYNDGRAIIWIRWNVEAVRDYKIAKLSPAQRWLFIGLTCLACKHKNQIPHDKIWLAEELRYPKNAILRDLSMLQTLELLVTKCDKMSPTDRHTDNTNNTDNMSGKPDFSAPILYLNEKAKTNYDPKNKANTELVRARFAEGRTLDQFKSVVDRKVAEWLTDEKMHKYLRPSTLFSRTHFEEYLNEPTKKEQSILDKYEVKK